MSKFNIKIYDLNDNLSNIDFQKLKYAVQEFLESSRKGEKLMIEIENLGED